MTMIPYGRQWIDEDDIEEVVKVLRSDWITTGPAIPAFEKSLAETVGAKYAIATSNGTSALHAAMASLDIGPGDEVIVPPITFVSTANCVLFQGARPVFADVDPATLLIDTREVEQKITANTKAILAVDYAGHPCDYDALNSIAESNGLVLVADSCHALGARWHDRPVGSIARISAFSFHAVKPVTTAEGGALTTDDEELAGRMRSFRNHGISADFREREKAETWEYEVRALGFNYRLTDIQCALGESQLRKLERWVRRRNEIALQYDRAFSNLRAVRPLGAMKHVTHAYHLYVIQLDLDSMTVDRAQVFSRLRRAGIGVNVHYIPVHLHPYYREVLGTAPGLCPNAERAYERILSLPIFPRMTDDEVDTVISTVREAVG